VNIKLTLEYRGTNFFGWQKQPKVSTIEKNIEDALLVYFNSCLKKQNRSVGSWDAKLHASGRTDAGVHSRGQVVNFHWPDEIEFKFERFLKSINSLTHDDISILTCEQVQNEFHARKCATSKTYTYEILFRNAPPTLESGLVWHLRKLENLKQMIQSATLFCGEHNFASFRASDCNASTTIRKVYSSYFHPIENNRIRYSITGSGFLKHQVRFIIGALIALGQNKISEKDILSMLDGKERPQYKIAPAEGLCLESVHYD